jgi:hypothetical protein
MLPDGFDRFEQAPVESVGKAFRRRARVRRLDLHALAGENLQARGSAVHGVTFRHGSSLIRPYRRSL